MLSQALLNGLLIGGIYSVIAIGMTLIFGVMRVINMAHGEFVMLGMYSTFWLYTLFGLDPFICIIGTVLIMSLVGMFVQKLLVSRAMAEYQTLSLFALMFLLPNIAIILWTADYRQLVSSYSAVTLTFFGLRTSFLRLATFAISVAGLIVLYAWLKWTLLGKAIRAIHQNEESAMLLGINVPRFRLLTFGFSTGLAGLAGGLLSMIYYIYPAVGVQFLFSAFTCVTLGGLGNVVGAALGGIIIGLGESLVATYFGSEVKVLFVYILLIIILILRPYGLLGKERE